MQEDSSWIADSEKLGEVRRKAPVATPVMRPATNRPSDQAFFMGLDPPIQTFVDG